MVVSGLFDPWYFSSSERKFPVGTFAPRNECSRELLFLVVSSLSDHGKGLAFSSH